MFIVHSSTTQPATNMHNKLTPADYLFAIAFGLALGALVGFGI